MPSPPKNRCRHGSWLLAVALVSAQAARALDSVELPTLDCVIEPHQIIDVSSGAEGVLSVVYVDRSHSVSKGQIIAALESDVEAASVEVAKARAAITTDIRLSEAKLGLDRRNMKRTESLFEKSAVALTFKDETKTEAELSALRLIKAREEKHIAELELARASDVLNRRTVRSPITGVVVKRFKSPGEFVEKDPILQVAQLDPLRVEVVVPFELYGRIHEGMLGEVTPELGSETVRSARVTVVDKVMDAASGTFGVRLELPNPDGALPGGLRCEVRFRPVQTTEPDLADTVVQTPESSSSVEDKPTQYRTAVTQPTVNGPPVCRTLGPITTVEQAELIAQSLQGPGISIAQRAETESSIIGYLVIAPTPAGTTQADFASLLNAKGVGDYQLYTKGDYVGTFSVGYYRGKESASARVTQMSKLGIAADVRPRISSRPEFWLNLTFNSNTWDELTLVRKVHQAQPQQTPKLAACENLVAAEFE